MLKYSGQDPAECLLLTYNDLGITSYYNIYLSNTLELLRLCFFPVFSVFNSVSLFTLLAFTCGIVQGAGWPACANVLRHVSNGGNSPVQKIFVGLIIPLHNEVVGGIFFSLRLSVRPCVRLSIPHPMSAL